MRIGVLGPGGALLAMLLTAFADRTSIRTDVSRDPACPHVSTGDDDAASCARCHQAIHDEWRGSAHARAWSDETYQAALRECREPTLCHGCHVPEGVHGRLGRPPRARSEDLHDGVGCAACHVTRSGIAGPFGADAGDAHVSLEHPAFDEAGSLALCASCHDLEIGPVLPLARDFRAAGLADRRKSCIGCHMPRVERAVANAPGSDTASGPVRDGRSHRLRGPSDPEFAASAFKLRVATDASRPLFEVTLGNRAGHRIPGLLTRAFEFEILALDANGKSIGPATVLTIDADNPLRVAETRRFHVPRPERAAKVRVIGRHRHGDADPVGFLDEELEP